MKHIYDEILFLKKQCGKLDLSDLLKNEVLQRACIRSLEVIGEAVKNLSDKFKVDNPKLDWKKIAGLRDILIHHYFGVDWDILWDIIKNKLPTLEGVIESFVN